MEVAQVGVFGDLGVELDDLGLSHGGTCRDCVRWCVWGVQVYQSSIIKHLG
jgi:hypothetical protein